MMKFIKLSSHIINTNYIKTIVLKPDKYYINFVHNKIDGVFIFGGGVIDSINDELEICKNKSPEDYKIVSDFISKLN
jgi:hypothetical protein